MKKLSLLVGFLLFALLGFAQNPPPTYPCGTLTQPFYCFSTLWIDTLDLHTDTNYFEFDTATTCNLWQRGYNQKSEFGAPGADYGIVTDSVNPYLPGGKCSFILKIPFATYFWGNSFLLFEHKYLSDSLHDGGYIEYSCDKMNWEPVVSQSFTWPPAQKYFSGFSFIQEEGSYYDPNQIPNLHDTTYAFTGTNTDWQWSGFEFTWFLPVKLEGPLETGCSMFPMDTLYYRFTFESDTVTDSLPGWMIRNLAIGGSDVGGAVLEQRLQHAINLSPNPTPDKISISAPGLILQNATVINAFGQKVLSYTLNSSELSLASLPSGMYSVEIETNKGMVRKRVVRE